MLSDCNLIENSWPLSWWSLSVKVNLLWSIGDAKKYLTMSSDSMNTTPPPLEDQGYTAKSKMSTKFSTKAVEVDAISPYCVSQNFVDTFYQYNITKQFWSIISQVVFLRLPLETLIPSVAAGKIFSALLIKYFLSVCLFVCSSGGPYHHNMLLQKDWQEERGRQQGNVSV